MGDYDWRSEVTRLRCDEHDLRWAAFRDDFYKVVRVLVHSVAPRQIDAAIAVNRRQDV